MVTNAGDLRKNLLPLWQPSLRAVASRAHSLLRRSVVPISVALCARFPRTRDATHLCASFQHCEIKRLSHAPHFTTLSVSPRDTWLRSQKCALSPVSSSLGSCPRNSPPSLSSVQLESQHHLGLSGIAARTTLHGAAQLRPLSSTESFNSRCVATLEGKSGPHLRTVLPPPQRQARGPAPTQDSSSNSRLETPKRFWSFHWPKPGVMKSRLVSSSPSPLSRLAAFRSQHSLDVRSTSAVGKPSGHTTSGAELRPVCVQTAFPLQQHELGVLFSRAFLRRARFGFSRSLSQCVFPVGSAPPWWILSVSLTALRCN